MADHITSTIPPSETYFGAIFDQYMNGRSLDLPPSASPPVISEDEERRAYQAWKAARGNTHLMGRQTEEAFRAGFKAAIRLSPILPTISSPSPVSEDEELFANQKWLENERSLTIPATGDAHRSDCALYNAPEREPGPCNCHLSDPNVAAPGEARRVERTPAAATFIAERQTERAMLAAALKLPTSSDEEARAYDLGATDGFTEALRKVDAATGGTGEFCPNPTFLLERIIKRFAAPSSDEARLREALERLRPLSASAQSGEWFVGSDDHILGTGSHDIITYSAKVMSNGRNVPVLALRANYNFEIGAHDAAFVVAAVNFVREALSPSSNPKGDTA